MVFSVGQKVVCVNDEIDAFPCKSSPLCYVMGLNGLTEGNVYTVRGVFLVDDDPLYNYGGVYLEEITRPINAKGVEAPYHQKRFVPLQETGMKILESILEDCSTEGDTDADRILR